MVTSIEDFLKSVKHGKFLKTCKNRDKLELEKNFKLFRSTGSSPLSAGHSLVYLSCILSRQVSNNSPNQVHIGARDCYLSVIKLLREALLRAAEKDVKPL